MRQAAQRVGIAMSEKEQANQVHVDANPAKLDAIREYWELGRKQEYVPIRRESANRAIDN